MKTITRVQASLYYPTSSDDYVRGITDGYNLAVQKVNSLEAKQSVTDCNKPGEPAMWQTVLQLMQKVDTMQREIDSQNNRITELVEQNVANVAALKQIGDVISDIQRFTRTQLSANTDMCNRIEKNRLKIIDLQSMHSGIEHHSGMTGAEGSAFNKLAGRVTNIEAFKTAQQTENKANSMLCADLSNRITTLEAKYNELKEKAVVDGETIEIFETVNENTGRVQTGTIHKHERP